MANANLCVKPLPWTPRGIVNERVKERAVNHPVR